MFYFFYITQDMDLIEILLRQDIDLGVTREVFDVHLRKVEEDDNDPIEALKEVQIKVRQRNDQQSN